MTIDVKAVLFRANVFVARCVGYSSDRFKPFFVRTT